MCPVKMIETKIETQGYSLEYYPPQRKKSKFKKIQPGKSVDTSTN